MPKYTMQFNRSETTVKLAELDGRSLAPHEGFNRGNDGDWIIPIKDDQGNALASVQVFFQGKAKRGSAHTAPDEIGQRVAQEIVAQFNRP